MRIDIRQLFLLIGLLGEQFLQQTRHNHFFKKTPCHRVIPLSKGDFSNGHVATCPYIGQKKAYHPLFGNPTLFYVHVIPNPLSQHHPKQ